MDWRQLRGLTEYRSFEVRFFNNKDVNIALWDPEAEFCAQGRAGQQALASLGVH